MTSNARNIFSLPIHKRLFHSEGTCQSTASLLFMITPPSLSWIFTKYANEWPPRKKIRKGSTRKKINTKKEQEVVNTKKDPEVVNTKKDPEVVNTKKNPEVGHDLWPLTRDLCPLTLTRKRPTLTTVLLLMESSDALQMVHSNIKNAKPNVILTPYPFVWHKKTISVKTNSKPKSSSSSF